MNFKNGREIELTGITREEAAKVIVGYFGTESYYARTYYKTYGAKEAEDHRAVEGFVVFGRTEQQSEQTLQFYPLSWIEPSCHLKKGTVEFRLFNSTTHAGEIKVYIQFCLAVNHQVLTQKSASPRRTVMDNEKTHSGTGCSGLACLGMNLRPAGCILLKNLEGNSAWKHGA